MKVDEVPEVLEVSPRGSGDACLGKGETWEFQQSMFTRLDEIGQFLAWYGNRYGLRIIGMKQVKSKLGGILSIE